MRMKWFGAVAGSVLSLVLLVLAASAAGAKTLENGTVLNNPNAFPAVITYSWSGHFAGGGEV